MAAPAPTSCPKTRRIAFRFGESGNDTRYFADGDMVFSHAVAFLSAVFPPGEDIFVRSVRRYREKITDPDLRKRVAGFIGQEMTHGLHHRDLNNQLSELGYPTAWFDFLLDSTERTEDFLDAQFPDPDRLRLARHLLLAFTAGAEHFTAVLAEHVLTRPELQDMISDPEIKNLLNWHAIEELEHKSVAFDVYRAVGGSEMMRIGMMHVLSNIVMPTLVLASWASIVTTDKHARRRPVRVLWETAKMIRGPLFRDFYGAMRPYKRRGFHPDDIDTTALLQEWQDKLFGTEGELVGHLK